MKRFSKIALSAAMLVGAAVAVTSPASAQVPYGYYGDYYGAPTAPVAPDCDPYSAYYTPAYCAPAYGYDYYAPNYYYGPDIALGFGFGGGWGHGWGHRDHDFRGGFRDHDFHGGGFRGGDFHGGGGWHGGGDHGGGGWQGGGGHHH